jgi:hypothetical protein
MSQKHCCCRACARFRAIDKLMDKYKMTEAERKLIDDLMMEEVALSESNSYWEAIQDGSWPHGREMLLHMLEKYPEVPNANRCAGCENVNRGTQIYPDEFVYYCERCTRSPRIKDHFKRG